MEESDMNISEWDIVNSNSLENKELEDDSEDAIMKNSSEDATEKDEIKEVPKGSSVEDVQEPECQCHSDCSCSSSDIDIIDEGALDLSRSNISIPSIESPLSSSFENNLSISLPARPESEPIQNPGAISTVQSDQPLRNPHIIKDYFFVIIVIGCLMMFFMHIPETPVDVIKEMETRITTLQEENRDLKSQVISKIEDDKLFVGLEEQITALKGENLKLSQFMQDLIRQLEEQNIIFKKESEIKGKESYQKEVDKLKEQVNILQIDNEELQKQLVRMRYGIYSPRAQDPKTPDTDQKKEPKDDISEGKNENSSEILSEEIKELRKKLYSEVEKLKNWKESVQHLMKELENRPKEFENTNEESRNKFSHGEKPADEESRRKYSHGAKPTAEERTKDNRYKGMLKDLNDHLNGAFDNIPNLNITDLVIRYMGVDQKKVKGVFESVGRYFKKAQQKTKDIFDENMKNDMWNFIGGLRKQWHMIKKVYFPKYPKKVQSSEDDNDYEPHFTEKYPESSHQSETSPKNYKPQNNPEMVKKEKHATHIPPSDVQDEFKKEPNARIRDTSKWQAYNQKLENSGESTVPVNSWVFERAAHRSELRENEEDVNWFLKNRKDVSESDNLKQNEHAADPYENIDDLFAID